MADINATKPVTAPAVPAMVFDKWFMTQIIGKFDATSGQTNVRLRRANKTGDTWTLMPNDTKDAEVSFSLDIFKEMAKNPSMAAGMNAVIEAVTSYANQKNLL